MGVSTSVRNTCPVCGAGVGRVIYSEARDPITLDIFRVSECDTCHLAYTEPRPTSLDRYYPQRYRDYGPLVTYILKTLYAARVARWANGKPTGGAVLEIGCGPGLMLAAFAQRGWRALGVERNEEAAARARSTPGVEITAAPLEQLPGEARFDLIILFHVLEHIREPVPLLKECAKRLAPGGRVIVNVPNFASWQSRFAGPCWLHLDVPRHLVHFTPETLANTFERSGLKLKEVGYKSFEHDPYGWIQSALSRITGRLNTLTRFLMGMEPFSARVALSVVIGIVLCTPALCLAIISWPFRRGALMEVIACLPADNPH